MSSVVIHLLMHAERQKGTKNFIFVHSHCAVETPRPPLPHSIRKRKKSPPFGPVLAGVAITV